MIDLRKTTLFDGLSKRLMIRSIITLSITHVIRKTLMLLTLMIPELNASEIARQANLSTESILFPQIFDRSFEVSSPLDDFVTVLRETLGVKARPFLDELNSPIEGSIDLHQKSVSP